MPERNCYFSIIFPPKKSSKKSITFSWCQFSCESIIVVPSKRFFFQTKNRFWLCKFRYSSLRYRTRRYSGFWSWFFTAKHLAAEKFGHIQQQFCPTTFYSAGKKAGRLWKWWGFKENWFCIHFVFVWTHRMLENGVLIYCDDVPWNTSEYSGAFRYYLRCKKIVDAGILQRGQLRLCISRVFLGKFWLWKVLKHQYSDCLGKGSS